MIVNIVDSRKLFRKNVWSVQLFLPQEALKANRDFTLMKLGSLIRERRESVHPSDEQTSVNYIGLENIEAHTGRLISFAPKQKCDIKSTGKRFCRGDILYGRLRPALNKVYYNDKIEDGICTTEILVLTPCTEKVNPVYLSELLRTTLINSRITNFIKGSALPRVSMADLKQVELPIPSMEKQNELAQYVLEKRRELEEHIAMVQQLPVDIERHITEAFSQEE